MGGSEVVKMVDDGLNFLDGYIYSSRGRGERVCFWNAERLQRLRIDYKGCFYDVLRYCFGRGMLAEECLRGKGRYFHSVACNTKEATTDGKNTKERIWVGESSSYLSQIPSLPMITEHTNVSMAGRVLERVAQLFTR
nr:hypothetical protein L203_06594 [Cryptococcus depauperatus CBS 7841]